MVTYAGQGGVASAAAQTVSPAYPAGIAAGDALILTRAARSDSTVLVTPSGWTLLDERTGGSGAFASDTGPVRLARYWREASGSETGTLVCDTSPGTHDVQQAVITRYTRTAGTTWDIAASGGADNVASTDWSVTAVADPGITSGDMVEVALSWPTDAARTWSAEVLAASGATIAGVTVPIVSITTSLGADQAIRVHNYACSAGAGVAAPTYTATVNSGTNVAGPASMVRLREVATGVDGALTAGLAALAVVATGAVAVSGALAVALPAVTVALVSGSRTVLRPTIGTVVRPDTGTVTRPDTGLVARP